MYSHRNKLKDSRFSSKEFSKTKRNDEGFSPSARAIVKRAENKLALIIKGKKTGYGYCSNKSDKLSLVYPFCKRPKNRLTNKYTKIHKEREKKKRFSPRITSTLRSDANVSVASEKTFSNSFSVLRLQTNCSKVQHVESTPVDKASNKVFEKNIQEWTNNKPSSSGIRKSESKSEMPVIPYQKFAVNIKKSLSEASKILECKTEFNLKSKISKLLIETYNEGERNNPNIQVFHITPPLENTGMPQLVTEIDSSCNSPKLNPLCKNAAISSSSSSAVTPNFDVVSGVDNATCPTLIIDPIKLLKKYEQILPNESGRIDAKSLPRNIVTIPSSPDSAKVFSSITPKKVVVNPVSYMKQYDNMLSQNFKNENVFSHRFDRNIIVNENHINEFEQYGNLDHNTIFTGRSIFPTSSSTAVNSIFTGNNYKSAGNSGYYAGSHAPLPGYNEPEEIFTYSHPVIPFYNGANKHPLDNFRHEANSERDSMGQGRRLPEDNYIFNIQDQRSNIQHIDNLRLATPMQIKPPGNCVFPLSRDDEFEIEIPPNFELKIF